VVFSFRTVVVVGELSAEDEIIAFVREKGDMELLQAFDVLSAGLCIKLET
jgi:hypothetical protein